MNDTTKSQDTNDSASNGGSVTPVRSYHPMSNLREEIDQVFNRFLGESWPLLGSRFRSLSDWDPFRATAAGSSMMAPPVHADVTETEKAYEISMELPGMDERDVEIDVSDNLLSIKGEKRTEKEEEDKDHHLTERRFGSFRRAFAVPTGVEQEKVAASFAKGVLKVTLPKSKEAQRKARKIEITAH